MVPFLAVSALTALEARRGDKQILLFARMQQRSASEKPLSCRNPLYRIAIVEAA